MEPRDAMCNFAQFFSRREAPVFAPLRPRENGVLFASPESMARLLLSLLVPALLLVSASPEPLQAAVVAATSKSRPRTAQRPGHQRRAGGRLAPAPGPQPAAQSPAPGAPALARHHRALCRLFETQRPARYETVSRSAPARARAKRPTAAIRPKGSWPESEVAGEDEQELQDDDGGGELSFPSSARRRTRAATS